MPAAWDHHAKAAAAAPLRSLTDDEIVTGLHTVHRWENEVAALKARLVAEITSRDIPTRHGHRRTTDWLREQLLIDRRPARELVSQADALSAYPALEQAMLAGRVSVRQSVVIAETLQAIPTTLNAIPHLDDSLDAYDGAGSDLGAEDGLTPGRVP